MSSAPIAFSSPGIDLSSRLRFTATVVGSPALAAETIIASLTIPKGIVITSGVFLEGLAAWTVGTSGTASTLKVRQTDTAGTTIYSTGALPTAAGVLVNQSVQGVDTASASGQVYVMTLTITAGGAVSTVSAVTLFATLV